MVRPNWTLAEAGEGRATEYWATWTLRGAWMKVPGATTLTVAEADLVGSVLLVAVTVA